MTGDDLDHLAAEHVLGLLEGAESARVAELMASDPAFATAVVRWRERLAELDATAPPVAPSDGLWRRIEAGTVDAAHWGFLSRPTPEPETEIVRDPVPFHEGLMVKWTGDGTLDAFDGRALRAYRDSWGDPSRIHARCEDYRAGATRDVEADEQDLAAAKRIACPTLIVWGTFYLTGGGSETALDVWRRVFAPKAVGGQVAGGHFVAEEDPAGTLALLEPFLAAG